MNTHGFPECKLYRFTRHVNGPLIIHRKCRGSVSGTSATITWTTGETSDSQVQYGTTTDYGSTTPLVPSQVTSHTVTITGLQTGVLYHYRVLSRDAAGNLAMSGDSVMSTDKQPPIVTITSPVSDATFVTSLTAAVLGGTAADNLDVARVTWSNNRGGSGTATGTNAWNGGLVTLQEGANVVTVTARDTTGNTSTDVITITRDTTIPALSGLSATSLTRSTARIVWTTNEATDSQVQYGTTTAYGQTTALDPTAVTSHGVDLTSLTPGTLYHYRVRSRDAAGNLVQSGDFTFKTASP